MLDVHQIRTLTSPETQIAELARVRGTLELAVNERGEQELEAAAGLHGLSELEVNTFVDMAEARYRAKRMDPGMPLAIAPTSECACAPTCAR